MEQIILANLDAAGKTLYAFLNQTHGGNVLAGINDNNKIVGREYNDSVAKASFDYNPQ